MARSQAKSPAELRPALFFLALTTLVSWNLSSMLHAFIAPQIDHDFFGPEHGLVDVFACFHCAPSSETQIEGAIFGLIFVGPLFLHSGLRIIHRMDFDPDLQRNAGRTIALAAVLLGAALVFAIDDILATPLRLMLG